jgi:hypothetical protein
VFPPTETAFDVEFAQTSKWDDDQLIVISAFWDAVRQAEQLGLPARYGRRHWPPVPWRTDGHRQRHAGA